VFREIEQRAVAAVVDVEDAFDADAVVRLDRAREQGRESGMPERRSTNYLYPYKTSLGSYLSLTVQSVVGISEPVKLQPQKEEKQ
jgi:hypothetical protein